VETGGERFFQELCLFHDSGGHPTEDVGGAGSAASVRIRAMKRESGSWRRAPRRIPLERMVERMRAAVMSKEEVERSYRTIGTTSSPPDFLMEVFGANPQVAHPCGQRWMKATQGGVCVGRDGERLSHEPIAWRGSR
jgi:hypothetical protein